MEIENKKDKKMRGVDRGGVVYWLAREKGKKDENLRGNDYVNMATFNAWIWLVTVFAECFPLFWKCPLMQLSPSPSVLWVI